MQDEEKQRRVKQVQAEAARRLLCLDGHPHGAQSLGAVHLSFRQRLIYGRKGGTGCATE